MEGIASFYGTGGGSSVPIANLKTGTACVACYSEDGIMYRGIIESVNSASAVVLFCDYGNKEDVPFDKIKEISSEFMSLPIQGLMCRLLAAKPQHGGSWLDEEIIKFTNLTEGKELEAHIISKSNVVYEIVLKDPETGIIINEQFGAKTEELQTVVLKAEEGQSCELILPDQKYCVQLVAPATVEKVQVTWFINPEQFYCQMQTSQLAINDMMNAIQAAYCSKPPLASSVQVGCPVIAKFLSDGVLYRAEVKEIRDTSSLVVQFVDYGNCDIVMRSSVWEMEARFMALPKQALSCCLRGVKAVGSQWSGGDVGVDKYFKAETFSCTFIDCEQGKYNVSLMSEEGKSIADQLLEDGFAVAQVVHSETTETADPGEYLLATIFF
jgi:Tudor domain.